MLNVLRDRKALLRDWFEQSGIDAVVVGLSGGVDSAVTYRLLQEVARMPQSPLKRVVGLILPVNSPGATNQSQAAALARTLVDTSPGEGWEWDLTGSFSAFTKQAWPVNPWVEGQGLSVFRTPALYMAAAQLQAVGCRSVVAGTTNFSEGGMIGFYGKASDGMVDIQPIADLYKSEVVALAELLDVPAEIWKQAPRGDVWDGKTDEEMIGAPYHFLEVVQRYLRCHIYPGEWVWAGTPPTRVQLTVRVQLTAKGVPEFVTASTAPWLEGILALMKINHHKYCVGVPAVYFSRQGVGDPVSVQCRMSASQHQDAIKLVERWVEVASGTPV
jgi:NAD+ synthetase